MMTIDVEIIREWRHENSVDKQSEDNEKSEENGKTLKKYMGKGTNVLVGMTF